MKKLITALLIGSGLIFAGSATAQDRRQEERRPQQEQRRQVERRPIRIIPRITIIRQPEYPRYQYSAYRRGYEAGRRDRLNGFREDYRRDLYFRGSDSRYMKEFRKGYHDGYRLR